MDIPISVLLFQVPFFSNNMNGRHTFKVIKTALKVWIMKERSGNRITVEKNRIIN